MNSLGLGNSPLSSRNRLHYNPPSCVSDSSYRDISYDFTRSELAPQETQKRSRSRSFGFEAAYTLLSTSYSLLIIAFFKSIIDSLKPPSRKNNSEIPDSGDTASATTNNHSADLLEENLYHRPNNEIRSTQPTTSDLSQASDILPASFSRNESPPVRNLYESVFDLDTSDDDDLDIPIPSQYGTTLQVSKRSCYKVNQFVESTPYSYHNTSASELLNSSFPPTVDEYDHVISKFYAPLRTMPQEKYSLTNAMLAAIPSSDFSNFLKKERKSIQNLIFQERRGSQSKIRPLSSSQQNLVEQYWRSSDLNHNVVSEFSIDISVRDLRTLADGCWLNDNIIDFYLNLLTASSDSTYCWTTHFFTTLKDKGYQGVARWAKRRKVNLMEKDLVIIPINIMGTHWALAVVDNKSKTISYYDSLSSNGNTKAVSLLQHYMLKECERLQMPSSSYTLQPNMKTPQQQNGFDCGVFTCTAARYISRGLPLQFGQRDMKTIRRKMAFEIIKKRIIENDTSKAHM